MEKAVLNVKTLNITQGMNGDYSHKGELAIDIGSACEWFKAPFTGTIKRIYTYSNTVWLESNEKVLYADGTIDYMTVMTCHDNDISNLYVGKVIKQGETYYQPGTKGKVTGSHIHLSVGKGKFTGNGWHKGEWQKAGFYAWPINNQYDVVKALFLYDKVNVIKGLYDWKKTNDFTVEEKHKYKIGDIVDINGVYVSSTSEQKLTPAITRGTITKIVNARNPYLLDNGNIGWVNNDCIINKVESKYKIVVNCYWLNLRNQPNYGNNIYKAVKVGTKLEYLGNENGWAKVKYDNRILYCGEHYLK